MTDLIKRIASTTARLLSNIDRVTEIQKFGKIQPATIHLAPTDNCNLSCEWCSVKNRKGNELGVENCKAILSKYTLLGIKSVEITGGGEPLLHGDIEEIIRFAKEELLLSVGLITNGIQLPEIDQLDAFTRGLKWMRVSLSGLDFNLKEKYLDIAPNYLRTSIGCSYVFTRRTTAKTLVDIQEVAKHLGSEYVRIVPNCYTAKEIEWTRREWQNHKMRKRLENAVPPFFLQIKDYNVPPMCYWRYIKPFVNSDGFIYHCSTASLFAGYFPKHWRVSHWSEAIRIYDGEPKPFDTSKCKLCFYGQQNEVLDSLLKARFVKDKEFM